MILALVIAAVIAAAVMSSFFLPVFFSRTPKVTFLSAGTQTSQNPTPSSGDGPVEGSFAQVEVTPETVQSVIATLSRPASYYREMTVENIWGEGASQRSASTVKVWADGDFTKVETTLPTGLVQYCIVGDDSLYVWYGSDKLWHSTTPDLRSADLAQRIPAYEDVLALEQSEISGTGFELWNGLSCIYVEVQDSAMSYLRRYWVDVESGLLVSAETVKDGRVVYRLTSNIMELPVPQNTSFTLPDGTVLHQVSKT